MNQLEEEKEECIGTMVQCLNCEHIFRNIPNLEELSKHCINHAVIIASNRNISHEEIQKLIEEQSMSDTNEIDALQFGKCAVCSDVLKYHYFQLFQYLPKSQQKQMTQKKLNNFNSQKYCSTHFISAQEEAKSSEFIFILSLQTTLFNIQFKGHQ